MITTPTAEAEFCSLCSTASQAFGLKFLLQDLGETVEIKIGVDASRKRAEEDWDVQSTNMPVGTELGAGGQHRFDQDPM